MKPNFKSDFLKEISSRGFLHQCTDIEQLDKQLVTSKMTAYLGFDCTARSLHIGSLMILMFCRIWQKYGNRLIILIGGGTTKIGDPSDKDKERKMLPLDEIQENYDGIKKTILSFLDNPTVVNNNDWLSEINYLDFLREYGRKFSINRMLKMESIKRRVTREQEMSFLEFNYSLLQAYDFNYLSSKYNCSVQFGGSDQWGNIISGVNLTKRISSKALFGLTIPLITTVSGKKMGKSESGSAVWIDKDMTNPYDFWQFFRNTDDADIPKFLRFFTDFSIDEIENITSNTDINKQKEILATTVTQICHGEDIARSVESKAKNIFYKNSTDDLPKIFVESFEKIQLSELLFNANLASSKAEAKRLIKENGVSINRKKILENIEINNTELPLKISIGKKRKFLIHINNIANY